MVGPPSRHCSKCATRSQCWALLGHVEERKAQVSGPVLFEPRGVTEVNSDTLEAGRECGWEHFYEPDCLTS
jgi:hypothetical protein